MTSNSAPARLERMGSDTFGYNTWLKREDLQKLDTAMLRLYAKKQNIDTTDNATRQEILDLIFQKADKVAPLIRARSFRMPTMERNILKSRKLVRPGQKTFLTAKANNKKYTPHKEFLLNASRKHESHGNGQTAHSLGMQFVASSSGAPASASRWVPGAAHLALHSKSPTIVGILVNSPASPSRALPAGRSLKRQRTESALEEQLTSPSNTARSAVQPSPARALARQSTLRPESNTTSIVHARNPKNITLASSNEATAPSRAHTRQDTLSVLHTSKKGASQQSQSSGAGRSLTRQSIERPKLDAATPVAVQAFSSQALDVTLAPVATNGSVPRYSNIAVIAGRGIKRSSPDDDDDEDEIDVPRTPPPKRRQHALRAVPEQEEVVDPEHEMDEERSDSGVASASQSHEDDVSEQSRTFRPVPNPRAHFDDFFADRRIEPDLLTAGYRPTMVYSNPPQPPLDPEDPEWLQEMFAGLIEEREAVLDMVKHLKHHSSEALVEAELAARELDQEIGIMNAFLGRIAVAAGDEFVKYLLKLVSEGEGDPSEESEVELATDSDGYDDEEMPLFGPAELPYDPEQMAELMADAIPTEPNARRVQATSPIDLPSSPEPPVTPPAGGRRVTKRTRNEEDAAGEDFDADDERSPKRLRYREAMQDDDESSSPLQGDDNYSHSPAEATIPSAAAQNLPQSPTSGIPKHQPSTSSRPSSSAQAQSPSHVPSFMKTFKGFDTDAIFDPNDPAGRRPNALNSNYRENGDMFTPMYEARVGRMNFGTPSDDAQPSVATRAGPIIAHPTLGRRVQRSRATALQEVTGPTRGGSHSRTLGQTPTGRSILPAQAAGASYERPSRNHQVEEFSATGDMLFGQPEVPQYEDEQYYISQARS